MQLPLNTFLLRSSVLPIAALSDLSDYVPHLACWDGKQWEPIEWKDSDIVSAALPGDMAVVLVARPRKAAPWQEFIRRELDLLDFSGTPMSYGAIVFCAIADPSGEVSVRWLAWCFGSGSRLLQRSTHDPRFGLTIALNVLASPAPEPGPEIPQQRGTPRPQLREMRYRTTAPYFQQTGHRAARDIPVEGFRIDRASDLIAAIGGRANPSAFTSSILGGRSLRFRKEIGCLGDLAELSHELLELSLSKGYQDSFAWVDNIRLVEEEEVIDTLQTQLLADLGRNPIPPTVDAILPDDLLEADDDRAIRYIAYPRERLAGACRTNLTVEMIAQLTSRLGGSFDPEAVLDYELRFLDDTREVIGKARLVDCLCADLWIDGEQFIAYDGDFYRVDHTFVERIDNELAELPVSAIDFPPYGGETEPNYTARIRKEYADKFVVLDRELIRIEGETGIEVSDLVSESGALVHLKRKGKSSTLSHLFLQVANSCELLRRSAKAREQLDGLIALHSSSQALADAIREAHSLTIEGQGLEVVFGFLGEWRSRTVTSLPLFSRISLLQESRKVANLGYKPSVALIGGIREGRRKSAVSGPVTGSGR